MELGLEVKVNAGEIPRVAGRVIVACQAFCVFLRPCHVTKLRSHPAALFIQRGLL